VRTWSATTGRLWKIDLTTGSKVTIMKGLGHPIGLAITANRAYAYVTEESTSRLAQIDLPPACAFRPTS
jgi:sugar lactone lactonase YvrE